MNKFSAGLTQASHIWRSDARFEGVEPPYVDSLRKSSSGLVLVSVLLASLAMLYETIRAKTLIADTDTGLPPSAASAFRPTRPDVTAHEPDLPWHSAPTGPQGSQAGQAIIIDHTCADLSKIPEYWINQAKELLKSSYGHTSHGSQPISGMGALRTSLYDFNTNGAIQAGVLSIQDYMPSGDLGNPDRTSWASRTREYLNGAGSNRNVVIWAWSGQVSSAAPADIDTYLTLMNQLEADYANVRFVYMTGHLDGTGETGNLKTRNDQIRDYVRQNNKALFDFADIESYDPAGNYYPNETDACSWCSTWCSAHPADCTNLPDSCAHSHPFNCKLKGQAFWWMMARLAGWSGATQGENWPNPGESEHTGMPGAQQFYLPFANSDPVWQWGTETVVQNTTATTTAIALNYYDMAGRLVTTTVDTLPGYASRVYATSVAAGSNFGGSLIITGNQKIAAMLHETPLTAWEGEGLASYSGAVTGTLLQSLPIYRMYEGWNSILALQNTGDTTATLLITFRDITGTATFYLSDLLPGLGTRFYSIASLSGLGNSFIGVATVTSDLPLVGMVNAVKPSAGAVAQNGVPRRTDCGVPGTPIFACDYYLPWFLDSSNIWLSNQGDSTATVFLSLYNLNGTLAATKDYTVPVGGARLLYQANIPGLPSGFTGSGAVAADQRLGIWVSQRYFDQTEPPAGYEAIGNNGITSSMSVPYIRKAADGTDTSLFVQNAGASTAAVTVTYYNESGALFSVEGAIVPAFAAHWFKQADNGDLPAGFRGSAVIAGAQPFAVMGHVEHTAPSAPSTPLTSVTIAGPTTGTINTVYSFTATVSPVTATTPITYTWSPAPDTGQGTASASYQWTTPGVYTITLMAENAGGAVSDTHTITISAPPGCSRPLSQVSILGPTSGYTGTLYTFTSIITPSDATTPVTFTWSPAPDSGQGTTSASYRWTAPGVYTLTLAAENCGGTFDDTHTVIINAPPPSGDHEPNDACAQASFISTDGIALAYTFYQVADEDWVAFYATAGITYVIEARVPPTSTADVVLELYDSCSAAGSFDDSDPIFSPDIRLTFQPPASRVYYLRLSNYYTSTYSPDVVYYLSIRALQDTLPSGAIILVGGRLRPDDRLQANIHHVTDALYRFARTHGCSDDQIRYLATDTGLVGVDDTPTTNHLRDAITQWAVGKVSPDHPLTLYLVNHGNYDRFYLDGQGEAITPVDLDGWLDQLDQAVPGVQVNVIVEACRSGSFIDPDKQVSKAGRAVMASTSAQAVAYASDEGAIFSDAFLNALEQGTSLRAAFEEGTWAVGQGHPEQTPWLDDDGDGLPNETEDGQVATQRGFACAALAPQANWSPHITNAQVRNLQGSQGEIWTQALDDKKVKGMWAVVYPPSWKPPAPGDEMIAEPPPVLLPPRDDGGYGGLYTFSEVGVYHIVVYAEDEDGMVARPREFRVMVGGPAFEPDSGGSLEIPIAGYTVTVDISSGAVTETTTLTYTPFTTVTTSPPGWMFAGRGFDLDAYQGGQLVPQLELLKPITLTIRYGDQDVDGLNEETLTLYYWDGSAWSTGGLTVVERDVSHNRLVAQVTHLTEFALFGQKQQYWVYLPVVMRNTSR